MTVKEKKWFRLYLVTDRKLFSGEDALCNAIGEACAAGADCVQLREKDMPARALVSLANRLRKVTRETGARLFINDRVDVALACDADGVHLGAESMPASAARKASGGRLLIGVSVHGIAGAKEAEAEGADFITFGPVYETPSKMKYGAPVGLRMLSDTVRQVSFPVYAIGGITPVRVEEVLRAGAAGVALITAILGTGDVTSNTESIMRVLE